jgi:DNA-binding transcriptional LysR family regulator
LRLGVGDDLEPFILPLLVKAFAEHAPGIRLVNRPCNFATVCDLLDADLIDVALCPQPAELRSWHAARVLTDEGFLCVFDPFVLPRHTKSGKLTKAQYFSTPHIVRATDGATRTRFDDLFEQHGHQRTVAATSATFLAAAMAIRGRRMLVNMPATAARLIAREFGLSTCPLPIPVPTHQLALLCHATRAADPQTEWMQSIIEQAVLVLRARTEV